MHSRSLYAIPTDRSFGPPKDWTWVCAPAVPSRCPSCAAWSSCTTLLSRALAGWLDPRPFRRSRRAARVVPAPTAVPAPQRAPWAEPYQCCGRCSSPPWLGSLGPPRTALTAIPMRQHLDLAPRPTSPDRLVSAPIRLLRARLLRARLLRARLLRARFLRARAWV